jgi:hypothetical protein
MKQRRRDPIAWLRQRGQGRAGRDGVLSSMEKFVGGDQVGDGWLLSTVGGREGTSAKK